MRGPKICLGVGSILILIFLFIYLFFLREKNLEGVKKIIYGGPFFFIKCWLCDCFQTYKINRLDPGDCFSSLQEKICDIPPQQRLKNPTF